MKFFVSFKNIFEGNLELFNNHFDYDRRNVS